MFLMVWRRFAQTRFIALQRYWSGADKPAMTNVRQHISGFTGETSGVIAIKFALMVPILTFAMAATIDYSALVSQKHDVQNIADIGALAGAKELSFSDANRDNVEAVVAAVAQQYAAAQEISFDSGAIDVKAVVTDEPLQVTVTVKKDPQTFFKNLIPYQTQTITATSVAEIIGSPNVCVLALDPSGNGALSLEHHANVLGRDCSVFSNSTHTNAINAKNSSKLTADFICSRGGKSGGPGNFSPDPMTDCPGFDDPLSSRPAPEVPDHCDYTDLVIDYEARALVPGTYCGGITITNTSEVTLDAGTYVIKDGKLIVEGGSELSGLNVGFYFTGDDAGVNFRDDSIISLEAQTNGLMAGLLFFSDRAQSPDALYEIMSKDARVLLGTIYLPNGELRVGADGPVADQSAYTAVVARKMRLYGGPQLVLNTNYDQTDVPVPEGIRGTGQPIKLVQ